DTNADHFAAYRLDRHGNPVGDPRRFPYDLSGTADHRDAQIRHALTRLLHWTKQSGAQAIGIENLDFAAEKTREKHGCKKRFRQLISGIPTGKLKARIVSMAAEHSIAIVAVDPAYTSMWGEKHWPKPLISKTRSMTRHDAASVAMAGAPSGTRSGDGRHRPSITGVMVLGIGPSRPLMVTEAVRKPAAPSRSAHTMRVAGQGQRERGRPAHPKPFGMRAVPGRGSKTRPWTLFRNGL
ncbi:hypothetical protein ACFCWG_47195, partial [Streptomyces sp. NPDC056390]